MLVTDKTQVSIIMTRRQEWADALLHGGYSQGRTYLKSLIGLVPGSEQYCCLGVACEVFGREAYIHPGRIETVDSYRRPVSFFTKTEEATTFLPMSLRKFLGLSHNSEVLLAKLNDSEVPFSVIAGTLPYLPIETGDDPQAWQIN